jgi:signal transduction histidine kinase
MVLTAVIIATLFISQKRKFRHRLELTDLKNDYDRELLKAQLEIQTNTFETISRELHDNAGTILSIATVHLKSIEDNGDVKTRAKILEVESLLNEAMDLMRDISRSLNPENIKRIGWQQSFVSELERISRAKLFSIETSITGTPFPMEGTRQIILFRMLQEAINNIVKHSEATKVQVNIEYGQNKMEIAVSDNGKGIDKESSQGSDGSGLRNMKARALMLPAQLDVYSQVGKGTTITIRYNREDLTEKTT